MKTKTASTAFLTLFLAGAAAAFWPLAAHGQIIVNAGGAIDEYSFSRASLASPLISSTNLFGTMAISGSNLFIVVDGDGSPGSASVSEYTISGDTVSDPLVIGLDSPYGLAVSDDGTTLFVADPGDGTVSTYDTTTGFPVQAPLISGLPGPISVAVSGTDLWVLISNYVDESGTTGYIGLYSTDGDTLNASLVTGLDDPEFLALSGPDLFVASSGVPGPNGQYTFEGTVGEYDSASGTTINASLIHGLTFPQVIAVSGTDIFVSNNLDLDEYNTDGLPWDPVNGAALLPESNPVGIVVISSTSGVSVPTLSTPVLTSMTPGTGNNPWTFTVTEQAPAGTTLQLQYSNKGSVWTNLASTSRQAGDVFTLSAAFVPPNAAFFQVVAQGGGSSSLPSNYKSLFAVDATIALVNKTNPVVTAPPIGKGIINVPTRQTLTEKVNRDASVIFAIHLTNNSRFPDSITFAGEQDSSFFTVQFLEQASPGQNPAIGPDITLPVFDGAFQVLLPAGGAFTVYMKVNVSELAPAGWTGGFGMEMTSASDPEVSDMVAAVVNVSEPKGTIYVRNTNDSGADSLRDAITIADAGRDVTIKFAIPPSDPGFVNVSGGQQFVITPATLLPPIIGHGTILDGSSETDATGVTNTTGPSVAIAGPTNDTAQPTLLYGLALGTSQCVVKGLEIESFTNGIAIAGPKVADNAIEGCQILGNANSGVYISLGAHRNTIGGASSGDGNFILPLGSAGATGVLIDGKGANGNFVYGNTIGNLDAEAQQSAASFEVGVQVSGGAQGNYIGGAAEGMGNVISGNYIGSSQTLSPVGMGVWIRDAGTDSNFVLGNYIGTAPDGNSAAGNVLGVYVSDGASDNNIGSSDAGGGNTISGNLYEGVTIESSTTTGNIVAGNTIGTNPVGNGAIPNGGAGVLVSFAGNGNVIGGKTAADGNIISGNAEEGIRINSSNGTVIENNLIGTAFDGTSAIPNGVTGLFGIYDGIILDTASQTSITDNTIAFNTEYGVDIEDGIGNTIRQNKILYNDDLGIFLNGGVQDSFGVAANHTGNSLAGPNEMQNYPVLTDAYTNGTKTIVTGTVNSTSNTVLYIDFYINLIPDPSGYGEGQSFIGSGTLTTDSNGNASFNYSFPKLYAGSYVTSTLTRKVSGSTSEFSGALLVGTQP